jgi:hypothetical protein
MPYGVYGHYSNLEATLLGLLEMTSAVNHPEVVAAEMIIRVMTDAHLPIEQDTAPRRGRRTDRVRVCLPAFKHVRASSEAWEALRRPHWRDDLVSGQFAALRARVTRIGQDVANHDPELQPQGQLAELILGGRGARQYPGATGPRRSAVRQEQVRQSVLLILAVQALGEA